MSEHLEWTGERLTTSKTDELVTHHLHRYGFAMQFCKGKDVLDIASGEGYGSALLSKMANSVTGVDISQDAISFAQNKYGSTKLKFKVGSASSIPLEDASVDVIVSFETIEHHDKHDEMMMEFKRVLKPGGMLVISSPDKLNYSDKTGFKNPYHVKELYCEEFKILVDKYFKQSRMYYQTVMYGSFILPASTTGQDFSEYFGDFSNVEQTESLQNPLFNICIASDQSIPVINDFSVFDATKIIYDRERELLNSKTYRLGLAMTSPLRFFRRLFKRNH